MRAIFSSRSRGPGVAAADSRRAAMEMLGAGNSVLQPSRRLQPPSLEPGAALPPRKGGAVCSPAPMLYDPGRPAPRWALEGEGVTRALQAQALVGVPPGPASGGRPPRCPAPSWGRGLSPLNGSDLRGPGPRSPKPSARPQGFQQRLSTYCAPGIALRSPASISPTGLLPSRPFATKRLSVA